MEEGKMTDRGRGAVRRGDDDNFSLFLVVGLVAGFVVPLTKCC
jgi:hypothetical protein